MGSRASHLILRPVRRTVPGQAERFSLWDPVDFMSVYPELRAGIVSYGARLASQFNGAARSYLSESRRITKQTL